MSTELDLGALVEPGAPLSRAAVERYSRHLILPEVTETGQRRLANARVAVIGAGGLGSPVLTYLAAAGVGLIGIVDDDLVDVSNLQRQTVHRTSAVGTPKTASAVQTIADLNPLVEVREHRVRLESANALEVLAGYDMVIDGTDNFATRYLVNDACVLLGVPLVWGSVFRFEGQVSVFWARHGPHYRELYPTPPPPGSVPSCGEGGVLGVLCAVIGSVMATEAVKLICGIGRPLIGRLLVYNALDMTFRTVTVRKDPSAQPITALIDYELFCGTAPAGSDNRDVLVGPEELSTMLAVAPLTVVDVREPAEFALGALPGAVSIPLGDLTEADALHMLRDAAARGTVVLYCKSGIRSARAGDLVRAAGISGVLELDGGILAWGDAVDPSLPRY